MNVAERILELAIVVVLIVGGYQFYFWAQRQQWLRARYLVTRWDARIKYDPRWVLVYSFLYYPMILMTALVVPTWRDFALVVGCFLVLLAVQVAFFLAFPVAIPPEWRTDNRPAWAGTWAQRSMDLVWSFDKLRNSMPSMHVSMATMVDLTIWKWEPTLGLFCVAFPVLIALSALKTKQHYIVDVVPGAVLAFVVFTAWQYFVT